MGTRGFTIVELVITVGMVGVLSAIAAPSAEMLLRRQRLSLGATLVESQLREARMLALTRNTRVRVAFDCPTAGAVRTLAVTGDPAIDNAEDRCLDDQANDGPAVFLPAEVWFDAPPTLEFTGRGVVTALGANTPAGITVWHGAQSRTLVVTGAGRISVSRDE